ncbi:glycine/D-amino acid oxidase-like deaminating enzyme [Rhizobium sp. BK313]|uniref:DUF982 domain-containing protein n=1 Tax=Rhizobium sp. BK313 TaxID=2587081 RepID=UPI001061ED89|nr:DUF982 domain-containing protein [Rhizobium sp. BK313]MBB3452608.1 glycine/D-amino acid oxidase-like deaminating enzyme [Rhizobium sp. BK313]
MALHLWTKPVTVEARATGGRIRIPSPDRALEYMMNEWPTLEEGQAYKEAKQAMLDAAEGNIDPESARQAFIAALEEGEVYVFDK